MSETVTKTSAGDVLAAWLLRAEAEPNFGDDSVEAALTRERLAGSCGRDLERQLRDCSKQIGVMQKRIEELDGLLCASTALNKVVCDTNHSLERRIGNQLKSIERMKEQVEAKNRWIERLESANRGHEGGESAVTSAPGVKRGPVVLAQGDWLEDWE